VRTKVVAALYLGSFLDTETLVIWPAAWKAKIEDIHEDSRSLIIPCGSVALSVIFMLWFASVTCRDVFGQPHHTLPQGSAGVIGSLGAIMAVPALGYSFHHCQNWKQVRVSDVLLIFVLGAPIGFYFISQVIIATIPIIWV
jgi:hypothetical protein